jgi:hypothetical protein
MSQPTNQPTSVVFDVTDQNSSTSRSGGELERTVLGELRENPFEISVVQQAQGNIYTNPTTNIQTTHLYVKFTPSSMDDILKLELSDAEFTDYPLEYEVITMGDYYQDIVEGSYPTLYAVVAPNFEFPPVQYEIIDELYLTTNDPLLIYECFSLTNNLSRFQDYIPNNTGMTINDVSDDVIGMVPNMPDCGTGFTAVLVNVNPDPNSPPIWEWKCVSPPPPPTNQYDCIPIENERFPAGTVLVEDTQLGYKGVKRVKVIIRNQWYLQKSTWTNDNGCWFIKKEHYGKLKIYVKFKSSRCRIRGTQNKFAASWQWITTVKDYVGQIPGPNYNFNNTIIKYHMWTKQGSAEHIYWGAATVNNALHESHLYMRNDGINTPPNSIDIYVGRNNTYGYALMNTQYYVGYLISSTLSQSTYFLGPFGYLVGAIGATSAVIYLPDVYIGIDFNKSDKQKSLAYHEFAHTSHYDQVGFAYWTGLVNESILANGHGNQYSYPRDKLELCESWAEFLGGMTYTHKTYGAKDSFDPNSFYDWEDYVEHSWNESPNHIPIGLHHDLTDVGEMGISYNQAYPWATTNSISDNVSGISINTMFQALNSNTKSITDYKNHIINNSLNGNTISDVNNIFNSY